MRLATPLLFSLAALIAPCVGCGKPSRQDDIPTSCTKVGQTCSLPPGKLGSCVAPMSCTSTDCLVCQSQH